MNVTNEKLYEMIVEIKSQQAESISEIAVIKAAQSELRSDIIKWGVALFIGGVIVTTPILQWEV